MTGLGQLDTFKFYAYSVPYQLQFVGTFVLLRWIIFTGWTEDREAELTDHTEIKEEKDHGYK